MGQQSLRTTEVLRQKSPVIYVRFVINVFNKSTIKNYVPKISNLSLVP